jgi:DNA modification methylase
MKIKVVEKPELGPLVSPHGNHYIPIHNWYSYKHGYSRGLAIYLIKNFDLSAGAWVLDPFCGSGTTLLTCKELDINALGFDILPFAVFLSNVKISDYDDAELQERLNILKNVRKYTTGRSRANLPDIPLVRKAFKPEMEKSLLSLKSEIDNISISKVRSFFNLGFLSILESVSNTSKAGGFLRIVNRDVPPDVIESLFLDKVNSMLDDVRQSNKSKKDSKVSVLAKSGDARKLPTQRKFDAVITSPPYPNRHDYTRIYALEMIFDFVSTNEELKRIRYETIRSHVEARKKYEAEGYRKPAILDSLIREIMRNGTNNPQVVSMIEGYFEDMYLALSEIGRCLKNGGKVGLVISNVRFAGVTIPVDEILAGIGAQVGLTPKEVWVARYRGNSSQQMRYYRRKPSRESIIIWEKDAY